VRFTITFSFNLRDNHVKIINCACRFLQYSLLCRYGRLPGCGTSRPGDSRNRCANRGAPGSHFSQQQRNITNGPTRRFDGSGGNSRPDYISHGKSLRECLADRVADIECQTHESECLPPGAQRGGGRTARCSGTQGQGDYDAFGSQAVGTAAPGQEVIDLCGQTECGLCCALR